MAVCRGLIESGGGTIAFDPTFKGGARFVVDLPAAEAQRPPSDDRVDRDPLGKGHDGEPLGVKRVENPRER